MLAPQGPYQHLIDAVDAVGFLRLVEKRKSVRYLLILLHVFPFYMSMELIGLDHAVFGLVVGRRWHAVDHIAESISQSVTLGPGDGLEDGLVALPVQIELLVISQIRVDLQVLLLLVLELELLLLVFPALADVVEVNLNLFVRYIISATARNDVVSVEV